MNDDFPAHRPGDLDDLALLPRRFDALASVVEGYGDTMGRVLSGMDKVDASLHEVLHQQGELFKRIDSLDARMDALVSERIAKLEADHAEMARRLDELARVRRRRATRTTKRKARR